MNSLQRLKTISFRLEELGITHIRKKWFWETLATTKIHAHWMIFEPLWTTKNYKRNGGGKKYRMHSPLTLFADACGCSGRF
jgi:hexosaminidase